MRDILKEAKDILIYGAMENARHVVNVVDYLYPGKLVGLAVSNMDGNTDEIFGHKVRTIDDYEGELVKENTLVIIAMRPSLATIVKNSLADNGYLFCVSFCIGEDILYSLPEEIQHRFDSYAKLKNFLMRKRIRDTLALFRQSEGRDEV